MGVNGRDVPLASFVAAQKKERLYAVSYEPHNICGHGVDIGALSLVVLYRKSHAV